MKADVYNLSGQVIKQLELPDIFNERIRPDLINRAFLALRSTYIQPKGAYRWAGMETSAEYVGRRRAYRTMINIEMARLPKIKLPKGRFGEVRRVPQARKGRAAHPLKPEKIWEERINRKERRKAIRSAIAATAVGELVKKRGHIFSKSVPLVIEDAFETLKKAKEVREVFSKMDLGKDLGRAEKRKIKAGRGKMRGRRYRKAKSILVVVSKDAPVIKAAQNVPGVDVCIVKNLNAELLAPGGVPGRLTVYTESAVGELSKLFKG
jgi:large subunit ribosomal protein L4e